MNGTAKNTKKEKIMFDEWFGCIWKCTTKWKMETKNEFIQSISLSERPSSDSHGPCIIMKRTGRWINFVVFILLLFLRFFFSIPIRGILCKSTWSNQKGNKKKKNKRFHPNRQQVKRWTHFVSILFFFFGLNLVCVWNGTGKTRFVKDRRQTKLRMENILYDHDPFNSFFFFFCSFVTFSSRDRSYEKKKKENLKPMMGCLTAFQCHKGSFIYILCLVTNRWIFDIVFIFFMYRCQSKWLTIMQIAHNII